MIEKHFRRINTKFYAEYRLRGDIYNEGYGNGMTLAGSSSVRESEILSEDDNRTVFSSPAGLKVNCIHGRKGDVFECKTIASNEGNEDLVLELLSSFALKEINADKMHRACSFWSAEGKLLSQELTELDMERSWAYHGLRIENCASGGHRLEPLMMELCYQASFSDAHECKSIPLIAANLHRLIQPRQSQIWAVLRKEDDMDRICYTLSSAFLGRLCLSGDIFDLTSEKWDKVKEAISFYDHVKHIIRDGKTTAIKTNVKDYSKPEGYQAVLRVLHNEALLVVHTFENGKNPTLDEMIEGYKIKEEFGSKLDDDFRGRVYHLSR
ncbi:MAG: hypothetical protein K6F83_08325 [Clostridiales bacterium]|nr:hypothetical protein [Clostridiales bacterium]